MKKSYLKCRTLVLVTLTVIAGGLVMSCENVKDLPKSDFLALPSVTVRDGATVLDDSGKVKLIMYSPLMEEYDNKDQPYTEFRMGIKVVFYDGKKDPSGSVTSKYAKYTKNDNLWVLKDSVVVIDQNGVKLETELLNWNQDKDLIYTDRFVKITSEEDIMQGFGFESDSHLRHRQIKNTSAILHIKDEE